MALKIIHHFVSAKADGPDSTEVKPSNWNEPHDIATDGAGGIVVGRDTSGPGPLQELPLAYSAVGAIGRWIANVVGSFGLPIGTTGQRPSAPQNGEMRYNSDLGVPEVYSNGAWQAFIIGSPGVMTGMVMGWYLNTLPTGGWLFLNGDTIGDVSSGAAHADPVYQALFVHLWNLDNVACPVSGGRGADALSDWNAHKTLAMPDECGTVAAGADNMGGITSKKRLDIAANPLGPDGDKPGHWGGESLHVQVYAEMPSHTHNITPGSRPGYNASIGGGGGGASLWDAGGANISASASGGGGAMNNVQRTIIRNSVIKV